MQLTSVNIGQEKNLRIGTVLETTGIFKTSTSQPVLVLPLGLQDDFICDARDHGGPDQAIYIYGGLDYEWWINDLERELEPGTFGENLTISELESASFSIGDRLHIDQVILEVTAPRIPCSTLAARMGDPKFVIRYRKAERPGLYCRVIQPGTIQVGEAVSVENFQGETLTVLEMFRNYYENNKSEAMLLRQLNAPIAIRSRIDLELDLQKLLAQK
jgi:MOSC domain-containing protein YiiM